MKARYGSSDVRFVSSFLALALAVCGVGGCSGGGFYAVTETYTVNTADQWDIVSSNGSKGYISFWQDSAGAYISSYNTGGAALAGFTGFAGGYPPIVLRYPIRAGDTWSGSGISGGYTVSSETVVTNAAAQVTVAAGAFTCVETTETTSVPEAYNNGAYVSEYKRYFAPGVGLVKVVNKWHDGQISTGELQKYTVPSADPNDYFPLNLNNSWTFQWNL